MHLKSLRTFTALATFLTSAFSLAAQAPNVEFPAASPLSTVKQRVGLTDIEIVYSRPGVKDRKIFGGLEMWGKVWRTGANNATKVTFSTPVKLNGTDVPAGTYGLFTIPDETEWTVIINKAPAQWGAYAYDAKNDLVRVKAKPVKLAELVETFTIDVNDIRDGSATLNLIWEKTRVPVKIEVDVTTALVPQIEAMMTSSAEKKPYAQAAMFYLDHKLDLKKAAAWMDAAIAEQPAAFYLIHRKALILAKMGDKAGAIATAQKSIEVASKDTSPAKDEYLRLNESLIKSLK